MWLVSGMLTEESGGKSLLKERRLAEACRKKQRIEGTPGDSVNYLPSA